jgi:flagellar hook protein FlgE
MGISQALYTGVTGLSVNADGMSVIANNIANANAKGYKRDRAEFEDLLSTDMNSGSGPTQIGRGARLAGVRTIHTQGALKVTDNLTDMAIQGQGFFVVADPRLNNQQSAGKFFTRSGSFLFDKEGFLSDGSGGRVQGYLSEPNGNFSSRLGDLRIETNTIPPKPTDLLNLNIQLDSRAKPIEEPWNIMDPEKTSHFRTSVSVFDSHGHAHQATIFFKKTLANEDGVEWEWNAVVDNTDVTDPGEGMHKLIGSGNLKFDKFGLLKEEITNFSSVNFNNGAFSNQKINFDFGKNLGSEEGDGTNATTSIAANSLTVFHTQDGFEAGQLKSLKLGQNGVLTGVFTNGIQKNMASLALATFSNQDALTKSGQNRFMSTIGSGPANIGAAETGLRGSIYASALEEANVDLASEFVNMISTQRLFQANSRSITTTDNMIEEVINLKR